jgi:hypothetical protein
MCKSKETILVQFWTNSAGLQEFEAPRLSRQSAHEAGKVVSPTTGRLYSPGDQFIIFIPRNVSGTHLFQRLCRPQSHSATGTIKSKKNPIYLIKNRTRELLACSAVPQITAPPSTRCLGELVVFRAVLERVEGRLLHLSGIEPDFSILRSLLQTPCSTSDEQ